LSTRIPRADRGRVDAGGIEHERHPAGALIVVDDTVLDLLAVDQDASAVQTASCVAELERQMQ
jgi:hypothetical protein